MPTERVAARGATGPHQVLYVHGGGYQTGSPTSHRALAAYLSRAAGALVHLPEHRLAPEHPYPAAVDDVAAAYQALRDAGHPAQRIAVAGDSAGGGIVMALVLRLRTAGEEMPGSIGLISPLLDLDLGSPLLQANVATDAMLDPSWLLDAVARYRGATDPPELRPLDADLTGLPPVHVIAGSAEILLGDSDALVARIRAPGGAAVAANRRVAVVGAGAWTARRSDSGRTNGTFVPLYRMEVPLVQTGFVHIGARVSTDSASKPSDPPRARTISPCLGDHPYARTSSSSP